MANETHPWLKWPGCSQDRKIQLNNRLAELQHREICAPRFLDRGLINAIGISGELNDLFRTRAEREGDIVEIPMWERAFNMKEMVYREWCLEFYSSLEVDRDFSYLEFGYAKKLISFRLGGRGHHMSVAKFARLAGLLTDQEYANGLDTDKYLNAGRINMVDFIDEANAEWFNLTGIPEHQSRSAKASSLRRPLLRVVHKMLVHSFLHRSTQHDKVYTNDLWILSMMAQNDPSIFVCVPWALICHMETKGAGRTRDSQMCCGHFITRIAKNLGLATATNINRCSRPVEYRAIERHELEVSRLLHPSGTRLIDPTMVQPDPVQQEEPPQPRQRRPRQSTQSAMYTEIMRIGQSMDSMMGHYGYHMDRYQPDMEALHYQRYQAESASASSSAQWSQYAPPPLYPPNYHPQPQYYPQHQYHQQQQDDEEDDE